MSEDLAPSHPPKHRLTRLNAACKRHGSALTAVGLHLLLLLVLVDHPTLQTSHVQVPGSKRGTRMTLYYAPGGESQAAPPRASQVAARLTAPALTPVAGQRTTTETPARPSTQPSPNPGTDSLGAGDISMALLEHYPDPDPDLEALPPGTAGDVVLDIIIDAEGKVASIALKQGLGHGIDQTVIDTVRQWTYHPATRGGQAIASGQQLHFHYERV